MWRVSRASRADGLSRTVHDSPSVRPETKERVRAAMRELGYRPNFAGRSLRRGKFKTVGVAMFNITGTGNLDRMEGFAAAADKHGYAITLTKVDGHPYTLESASSRMSALPVDGMVVIMNRMPADFGTFEPLRHADGARYHAGAPTVLDGR